MTRQNFYILVDKSINAVISHPVELPEDWNNIHGLSSLTDTELSDLNWSGNLNFGWIKFNSEFPSAYFFADGWEMSAKESMKEAYSNLRWQAETKGIVYNGIEIGTDDRTKTTILLKKEMMSKTSAETFSWKYNGSIIEFDSEDVTKILDAINDYVQKCFEVEASLIKQLDAVGTVSDLTKFDFDIEWPSNLYS
jgi:hypothetical protein